MRATIALAPYDRPSALAEGRDQWLIVSRSGARGEFLTIALAGPAEGEPLDAPAALAPLKTLCGMLAESTDEACTFLLSRVQPEEFSVAGSFFPAEGYARVEGPIGQIRLVARGRHAHSRGVRDGSIVIADVPSPAPGAPDCASWLVQAVRLPWAGDLVSR